MSAFGNGTFEHPARSLRDLEAAFKWAEEQIASLTVERDTLRNALDGERALCNELQAELAEKQVI